MTFRGTTSGGIICSHADIKRRRTRNAVLTRAANSGPRERPLSASERAWIGREVSITGTVHTFPYVNRKVVGGLTGQVWSWADGLMKGKVWVVLADGSPVCVHPDNLEVIGHAATNAEAQQVLDITV